MTALTMASLFYEVRCTCGSVVQPCRAPGPHITRLVLACGVCTCTGGEPQVEPLAPALSAMYQALLLEEYIVSPLLCGEPEQ